MPCETDRPLTQAEREAAFNQQRTGVQRGIRPFTGEPTAENIAEYLNREVFPVLKQARDKINEVYLPVVDNATSANPLGFYFSTETANADPTSGFIRLDNATQDTATTVRVSQNNGHLKDITPWLDVMAGSATSPLGVVTLTHAINPGRFIRFDLSTMTDQGAYWDLAVTAVESSHDNPFVQGDQIAIGFIPGVGSGGAVVAPGAAPAWDSVLAAGNNTGANNPHIDTSQYIGFGVEGSLPGSGQIRSSSGLLVNAGGGNLQLFNTSATGGAALATAGSGQVAIASGTGDVAITAGTFVSINNFLRFTEQAASTPSASAGQAFFWVSNGAQQEAKFTDDTNTDYTLARGINGTNITFNGTNFVVDDFPLTGLADQADDTFLANISGAPAPPTAVALTTLAGAGLTGGADAILAVGAGTRITVNANDVQLAAGAAESFLGNFTASSGVADYRAGSSVAGAGLTYSAGGTLAVGAGTGITVNANDVAVTIPLTDGDKGHIVVSSSGTIWLWDPVISVTGDQTIATTDDLLLLGEGGVALESTTVPSASVTTGNVTMKADADILANAVSGVRIHAGATAQTTASGVEMSSDTTITGFTNGTERFQIQSAGDWDFDNGLDFDVTGSAAIECTGAGADFTVDAADDVRINATDSLVLQTALTTRLAIQADGSWDLAGNAGTSGQVLTSQGGSSPPAWSHIGPPIRVDIATDTDASFTVTPPSGATWFVVRMLGAGGGGGGADGDTDAEACAGGGGGGGGYHEVWYPIVSGNITGDIGSGGAAGSNAGGNGGGGNSTSFTYNSQTYSATGGSGGVGTAAGAGAGTATQMKATAGGGGGSHGVIGTGHIHRFTVPGGAGGPGIMYSNGTTEAQASAAGGSGGDSYMGGGAAGGIVNSAAGSSNGSTATGGSTNTVHGGGGGGGGARIATGAATGATGGVGAPGSLQIEFYGGALPTAAAIT